MIILELTPDEVITLRNLLDSAVRHDGLRAAGFALMLDQKIQQAAAQSQQTSTSPISKPGDGGIQ